MTFPNVVLSNQQSFKKYMQITCILVQLKTHISDYHLLAVDKSTNNFNIKKKKSHFNVQLLIKII